MTKMVFVVRKDLNMRKGKVAAQVAHACLDVFTQRNYAGALSKIKIQLSPTMLEWFADYQKKIVLGCESEEELLALYEQARKNKLPCSLVIDKGFTEFNGVETKTCIAIGPVKNEDVDSITGHLSPL